VSTRTQALSLVSAYKRTRERMDFRAQDQGTVDSVRLPRAYSESAIQALIATALILLVEREGLEPSTPAL
jgi:hypothetical protein